MENVPSKKAVQALGMYVCVGVCCEEDNTSAFFKALSWAQCAWDIYRKDAYKIHLKIPKSICNGTLFAAFSWKTFNNFVCFVYFSLSLSLSSLLLLQDLLDTICPFNKKFWILYSDHKEFSNWQCNLRCMLIYSRIFFVCVCDWHCNVQDVI